MAAVEGSDIAPQNVCFYPWVSSKVVALAGHVGECISPSCLLSDGSAGGALGKAAAAREIRLNTRW
jgi:hypothetical protein